MNISASLDRMGHHDLADRIDRIASRQMILPLEMTPYAQYSSRPLDFIPEDHVDRDMDDYLDDARMYHVTTDFPAVEREGLKSRVGLQMEGKHGQGLGGQHVYQTPEMISTTYSKEKAGEIEFGLQFVANIISGKIPQSEIVRYILGLADDASMDDEQAFSSIVDRIMVELSVLGVNVRGLKRGILNSDDRVMEEMHRRIDETEISPSDRYELLKTLENHLVDMHMDMHEGVWDVPPIPSIGLAATYDAIKHLDPEKVRIIEIEAKRGAPSEHIPQEHELNFYPWDVIPRIDGMSESEARTLQQTMTPERTHEDQ